MMSWRKFKRATMGSSFSIPKGLCIKAQGCLPSEVLLTKEGEATLGKRHLHIPNPNGVVPPSRPPRSGSKRRNPFGVGNLSARVPRVARDSQPWALRHNPVGIGFRDTTLFRVAVTLLLLTLNLSAAAKKPAKMAAAKVP